MHRFTQLLILYNSQFHTILNVIIINFIALLIFTYSINNEIDFLMCFLLFFHLSELSVYIIPVLFEQFFWLPYIKFGILPCIWFFLRILSFFWHPKISYLVSVFSSVVSLRKSFPLWRIGWWVLYSFSFFYDLN